MHRLRTRMLDPWYREHAAVLRAAVRAAGPTVGGLPKARRGPEFTIGAAAGKCGGELRHQPENQEGRDGYQRSDYSSENEQSEEQRNACPTSGGLRFGRQKS